MTGHATLLAEPPYLRLLRTETLLRRLLPLVIVAMVGAIALMRATLLVNEAEAIEDSTRSQINLVSEVIVNRLLALPGLEDVSADRRLAGELLSKARPETIVPQGRVYVLFTNDGTVLAMLPERVGEASVSVAQRLSALAKAPLGDPLSAMRQIIELPDGAKLRLAVLQDREALYRDWWASVAANVAMLLVVAITVYGVLFAFLRQNTRARVADELYMETQARFDTALYRGRCGLWDWDLARGRVFWSPSMFELLGREPAPGLLGIAEIIPLVHPDDVDLIELGNRAFQAPGNAVDCSFRIRHAAGHYIWMRARLEKFCYHGTDPHLIGIAVDISETEALKEKSAQADKLVRNAIDNISEAFVLWDRNDRLVKCNANYVRFFDLPAGSYDEGARREDVLAASRTRRIRQVVNADAADGTHTIEAELEGSRWLQVNDRRTEDGGLVSVGTDITQIKLNEEALKRSEATLKASNEDLQEHQRQMEIQAQQLCDMAEEHNAAKLEAQEAQARAEQANDTKSQFLANISHELRTPLNAIIGFSDMMRSRTFGPMGSEKYEEYASDIHGSGSHLLSVINDILDMSKIEAGRHQFAPERVNLREIMDETVRITGVQAESKSVRVNRVMPDSVPMMVDKRAMRQILLNLLSNAVKFTPEGGAVDVTMRRDSGAVKIAIWDSGCGIERSALKRLGVPFEQVQNQFTKNHMGSGLGLAIARSLVELHGGDLTIRSVPGRGTLVLVRLPDTSALNPPPMSLELPTEPLAVPSATRETMEREMAPEPERAAA